MATKGHEGIDPYGMLFKIAQAEGETEKELWRRVARVAKVKQIDLPRD